MNQVPKSWQSCVALSGLMAMLFLMGGASTLAQGQPSEWEVKAAFLFNFAKFIEWPEQKLPASAPLIIGVLGSDPFGDDLEKTIGGKSILGHAIQTRRYRSATEAREAHVLYISDSEGRRLGQTLRLLEGNSILTVAGLESFCEEGGMINFRIIDSKVRFEINQEAAEKAGLKLSSKLLSVAIVKE